MGIKVSEISKGQFVLQQMHPWLNFHFCTSRPYVVDIHPLWLCMTTSWHFRGSCCRGFYVVFYESAGTHAYVKNCGVGVNEVAGRQCSGCNERAEV